MTRARILQHLSQTIWLLFFATLAIVATPATAQNGDPVEVEARVEVIGIQSDIMIEDGDEFDSSRSDCAPDPVCLVTLWTVRKNILISPLGYVCRLRTARFRIAAAC